MRQIKAGQSGVTSVIPVTAEAVRIAKETYSKIMHMASATNKKLEHPVKLKISKRALEDLVTIHGLDAVDGMERDFEINILTSAALDGSRKAYTELMRTPEGRVRADRMKIKKP